MSGAAGDPCLLGITHAGELARTEAALSASRLIDLERRRLRNPHLTRCAVGALGASNLDMWGTFRILRQPRLPAAVA